MYIKKSRTKINELEDPYKIPQPVWFKLVFRFLKNSLITNPIIADIKQMIRTGLILSRIFNLTIITY